MARLQSLINSFQETGEPLPTNPKPQMASLPEQSNLQQTAKPQAPLMNMIPKFIMFQKPAASISTLSNGIKKRRSNSKSTSEEQQEEVIHVTIAPMASERRTSLKYKEADPCYKYQRKPSSGEGVDESHRSEEEKDADYEDYDILPYRWRLTREAD